jgi:hypothetical protein
LIALIIDVHPSGPSAEAKSGRLPQSGKAGHDVSKTSSLLRTHPGAERSSLPTAGVA